MGNVFEQMEKEGTISKEKQTTLNVEQNQSGVEYNYEQLSDVAVGEKKKYNRVILDKQTVTISSAKLFPPDTTQAPIESLNDKTHKYYPCNFIVSYDTPNQDREYVSGAIVHINRTGGLSEPTIWYKGASNQAATLWESVASFKKKKPEELSLREFLAFLNNKPKALIETVDIKFKGTVTKKNLVNSFVN